MRDHMTPDQMTPEQKLAALFAADTAPASDRAFVAEISGRIALRRTLATVAAMVPWVIAATAILWALAPVIGQLVTGLETALVPALGGVALVAAVLVGSLVLDKGVRRRLGTPLRR